MTHITLPSHRPVAVPRFAPIAADWFSRLLEVLHLARRVKSVRRERVTRITQANALRRYARSIEAADRGLASDLHAAADRYDRDV